MDLDALYRKLIAAARTETPSVAVPPGFARRITARLRTVAAVDHWAFWANGLWRAAAPCVAVMLLLSAWWLMRAPGKAAGPDFSQEFENTVLAASGLDQPPVEFLR